MLCRSVINLFHMRFCIQHVSKCATLSVRVLFVSIFLHCKPCKKSEPAIYFISQGNKTWGGAHWDTSAQPAQCSRHQFSTHKQSCDGQNCNRRENGEMRDKRETRSKEKREELKLKEIEGGEDTNRGWSERQRFMPILLSF